MSATGWDEASEWERAADPARDVRVWADESTLWLERDGERHELSSPPCKDPDMVSFQHVGFFDGALVLVYVEKHRTLAWVGAVESLVRHTSAGDADRASRLLDLGSSGYRCAVAGDVLAFHYGDDPGIVELRKLPALEVMPPLLAAKAWPRVTADDGVLAIDASAVTLPAPGRPSTRAEIVDAVVAAIAAEVPLDARSRELLVASAVGFPFAPEGPVARYEDLRSLQRWQHPGFQWLPVYAYEREAETSPSRAEALLHALDALAARTSTPRFAAAAPEIALATEYVHRRAAAWADVARTGVLPEGALCRLWHASDAAIEEALAREPPGLRDAVRSLAAHPPAPLSREPRPPRRTA